MIELDVTNVANQLLLFYRNRFRGKFFKTFLRVRVLLLKLLKQLLVVPAINDSSINFQRLIIL
ncbi:hypothetical protein BpHYR1_014343 [Brachionus plicatilis]|uniref:Uncharacterized protein n=1 Tax=Brachionus plicatilis TaxID=10195 RepID=A0A3M7PJV1_BRAPC|nr:hypothetical protein BpHYR1_014343 [Brachionus plicatilis]